MKATTAASYAIEADKRERDPYVIPGEHGRADVANGRMSRWERMNPGKDLVWIDDAEGRPVALTPTQHRILVLVLRLRDTRLRVTMIGVAKLLKVAPSTVSRALVKMAAWGLIAYQANRGRNGGTIIIGRRIGDTFDWFREEARAKVRAWAKKASERWVSRLRGNVAPYPREELSTVQRTCTSTVLRAQHLAEWTPDELRSVGII